MALLCGFVLSVTVPALGLCAGVFVGHFKAQSNTKKRPNQIHLTPPNSPGERSGASSKKEETFGLPGGSTPTGSYKRQQGEDWYQKRVDGTDVVIPYRYVMAPSGGDSPARNTRAKKNLRSLNIYLKKAGHGVRS